MAEWNLDFPDDFLGDVLNSNSEELCKEMIDEALPIIQKNMAAAFETHQDTGSLAKSVKISKAKKAKNNAIIGNVNPKGTSTHIYGKHKYKVSNALKAIWLENGTAKQPAKPWLGKVVAESERQVLEIMQKKYEEKVGAK